MMNKLSFIMNHSLIDVETIAKYAQRLMPEHQRIKAAWGKGYESDYASINLCNDTQLIKRIQNLADQMLAYNPEMIIVVGIGGSSLGARAVHEALNGFLYNDVSSGPRIYFVESVDADYTAAVMICARQVLEQNGRVVVNIVTKSGTTTETIANGLVFISLLQEFYPDEYTKFIVVTTDQGSKLHKVACEQNLQILEVPHKVGGRFSVLSAVGLFPLALVGIDVGKLIDGARLVCESVINDKLETNHAALSALIKYVHYTDGITINDMFLFSVDCAGLGQWYRQLMGESVGKMYNRQGEHVEVGITPTVSVGTVDLHSVGQLYLGGPRDKFITFVRVDTSDNTIIIPDNKPYNQLVANIEGKSFDTILSAIFDGVLAAYSNEQRPYVIVSMAEKNELFIGQFLQTYMFEIMYLGFLFDVNPFDQPQVELYKQETRKILADE